MNHFDSHCIFKQNMKKKEIKFKLLVTTESQQFLFILLEKSKLQKTTLFSFKCALSHFLVCMIIFRSGLFVMVGD
jgi:hypothetical protein